MHQPSSIVVYRSIRRASKYTHSRIYLTIVYYWLTLGPKNTREIRLSGDMILENVALDAPITAGL